MEKQEVHTVSFLAALSELAKIFDPMGKAFGFVKEDITSKVFSSRGAKERFSRTVFFFQVALISGLVESQVAAGDASPYFTLPRMVRFEMENNTASTKEKNSGSRTLLRLAWAGNDDLFFFKLSSTKINFHLLTVNFICALLENMQKDV